MTFPPTVSSSRGPDDGEIRPLRRGVLLFVVAAAAFAVVPRFEAPFASPLHRLLHSLVGVLWWEWYVVALAGVAAASTFYRRSASEALALAFASGAGVGVNLGGIGVTGGVPGLLFRLLWAASLGVAFAVVLGGAGYLLGTGLRRVVDARDGNE